MNPYLDWKNDSTLEMANRKNARWNDFDIIEPAENKTSETPITIQTLVILYTENIQMACTLFACILPHKQRYGCTLHHTNQNDSDFGFQFRLSLLEHGYIGDNRIELELSLESYVSALSIVPGVARKAGTSAKYEIGNVEYVTEQEEKMERKRQKYNNLRILPKAKRNFPHACTNGHSVKQQQQK